MKYLYFLAAACLYYNGLFSQGDPIVTHQAIIWHGFDHKWMYNHRVNCVGDYVMRFDPRFDDFPTTATHLSATGTGPDKTYFDTYYTLLTTHSAVFLETQKVVHLIGTYDSLKQDTHIASYNFDGPGVEYMRGKKHYITILNGFEMRCDSINEKAVTPEEARKLIDSKKLKYFKINIFDENYNEPTATLTARLDVQAEYDCYSLECKARRKTDSYEYAFVIYYLIIGYNDDEVSATHRSITSNENWTLCKELKVSPVIDQVDIKRDEHYAFYTEGIRSITVSLPGKAMHLLEWRSFLQPPVMETDPDGSNIKIPVTLLYKQWRQGMAWAHLFSSWFSFRQAGSAVVSMDYDILKFKTVDSVTDGHHHPEPDMYWPGGNTVPFSKCPKPPHTITFDSQAIHIYDIGNSKTLKYTSNCL